MSLIQTESNQISEVFGNDLFNLYTREYGPYANEWTDIVLTKTYIGPEQFKKLDELGFKIIQVELVKVQRKNGLIMTISK